MKSVWLSLSLVLGGVVISMIAWIFRPLGMRSLVEILEQSMAQGFVIRQHYLLPWAFWLIQIVALGLVCFGVRGVYLKLRGGRQHGIENE
jgi:hypothetical protein